MTDIKDVALSTEFENTSGMVFVPINEAVRTYHFPNGESFEILCPRFLAVSDSGGHRVWAEGGYCYYVQPKEGWVIEWRVAEGQPSFVK